MSRGLGKMQLALLRALEPAKKAFEADEFNYIGAAEYENVTYHMVRRQDGELQYPFEGPLVRQGGEFFTLDDGVYDLRATLVYLALKEQQQRKEPVAWQSQDRPRGFYYIAPAFRNAFTRAARSLVEQGLLIDVDDGKGPQLRFVSRSDDDDDDEMQ
jgi:hypothetical protein